MQSEILQGPYSVRIVLPDGRVLEDDGQMVQVFQEKFNVIGVTLFSPAEGYRDAYMRASRILDAWGLPHQWQPAPGTTTALDEWARPPSLEKWRDRKAKLAADADDPLGNNWDGVDLTAPSGVTLGVTVEDTFAASGPRWTVAWGATWNGVVRPATQPTTGPTTQP
jgi:hypothetical protein